MRLGASEVFRLFLVGFGRRRELFLGEVLGFDGIFREKWRKAYVVTSDRVANFGI